MSADRSQAKQEELAQTHLDEAIDTASWLSRIYTRLMLADHKAALQELRHQSDYLRRLKSLGEVTAEDEQEYRSWCAVRTRQHLAEGDAIGHRIAERVAYEYEKHWREDIAVEYDTEPHNPPSNGQVERISIYETEIPKTGPEARDVARDAPSRATAVVAAAELAHRAGHLEVRPTSSSHEGTIDTVQTMLNREQQINDPEFRELAHQITRLFVEQNIKHNAAYYEAYGKQASRQVNRDLSPPPRRSPGERLFGGQG